MIKTHDKDLETAFISLRIRSSENFQINSLKFEAMEQSKWRCSSSEKFQMKILKFREPANKGITALGRLQMKILRLRRLQMRILTILELWRAGGNFHFFSTPPSGSYILHLNISFFFAASLSLRISRNLWRSLGIRGDLWRSLGISGNLWGSLRITFKKKKEKGEGNLPFPFSHYIILKEQQERCHFTAKRCQASILTFTSGLQCV